MDKKLHKPVSAVNAWTGIIGVVVLFSISWLLKSMSYKFDLITDSFLILAPMAGAMALYEILIVKSYKSNGNGLVWNNYSANLTTCWRDSSFYVKQIGLLLSVGLILFIYQVPNYKDEYYVPFFDFLFSYAEIIIVVSLLYFVLVHAAMEKQRDGFWHLGACLIPGLWRNIDTSVLNKHIFLLCIKAFFLPLMFMYFINNWDILKNIELSFYNIKDLYSASFHAIFLIDVSVATIGYVCTLRIFNAHIRWPEMHWGGWLFCLICYAPFSHIVFSQFLAYHDGLDWHDWIGKYPAVYVIWGGAILICNIIFVYSTVNFGLRFSNLTHRGILTHGMYSLTKHPAYISKNLAWWLAEMPFMATSFLGALKNTLLLILVNLIYFMRARYEEKMLSKDPVYKQYCAYIAEHGIFSRPAKKLKSMFNFL